MRSSLLTCVFCLAAASVGTESIAHASPVLVDFDAQAASAPSGFTGRLDSPLTIGSATFVGGQLLTNELMSTDLSGVYGTTSYVGTAGYQNPITILFASGVSNVSLQIVNNLAGQYTVTDNLGEIVTSSLGFNGAYTFSLAGTGITSVSISQAGLPYDYSIDNVSYDLASGPAVAPEPSSLWLLGTGVVGAAGAFRRRLLGA